MIYDFDLKDIVRSNSGKLARWEVKTMQARLAGIVLLLSSAGVLQTELGGSSVTAFAIAGVLAILGIWIGFRGKIF